MTLLRCNQCRVIVDVSASASSLCAACGSRLSLPQPATIWDDDDPTVRRPTDYAKHLQSSSR